MNKPNYLHDPELAVLLTRLAALQGHAVPSYRFGMLEKTADGVEIAALPRAVQARELWAAHFPTGLTAELAPDQVVRGQFPLLWLSGDGTRLLLLRGQLSSGACTTEDAQGQVAELDAAAPFFGLEDVPYLLTGP